MMKKCRNILVFLLISLAANATSQVGDILIWKGDTLKLFSNPLELRSDSKELSKIIASELENEYRRITKENTHVNTRY